MKRQLTTEEIKQLEHQGCTADTWTNILVHTNFNANQLRFTHFEGNIEIGERVSISHVGVIKNYHIHDDVNICRVNEITCDKWIVADLCKDGVTVGNEAGEPNIRFTLTPNEQLDWLNAHHPQYPHAEEIATPEGTPVGEIANG